jgi:formate/nitrite transporter FocA (FNT family)
MSDFTPHNLFLLSRIWLIVLAANFASTLFAAIFCTFTPILTNGIKDAMIDIGRGLMNHSMLMMFMKGIAAPFLMAPRHHADELFDCGGLATKAFILVCGMTSAALCRCADHSLGARLRSVLGTVCHFVVVVG